MDNGANPLKNPSLYVGLVVIALVVAATFGAYRLYQSRTQELQSQSPSPTPQALGETQSPQPTPNLQANLQTQPQAGFDTGSVPGSQPATGPSALSYLIMLGSIPAGIYLARYSRKS